MLTYPNPFNQQTTISFKTKSDEYVTVDVNNINGANVETLFEGLIEGNKVYEVILRGDEINNGMYFYRLKTTEKSVVKKLVIIK